MVLYELLVIARPNLIEGSLKDLVRSSAKHVLLRGGVVRGFDNWGVIPLPKRMRSHQEYYTDGHHWLMHFDSNPTVMSDLQKRFSVDPRVIRANFVKLGVNLTHIIRRPDKTIL
ncbi:hypothetical protein G9A89_018580 [Geosiphon pyriformis]|nr:hypothetical protein G9A89_018580 [Geosiphon pyriformis]